MEVIRCEDYEGAYQSLIDGDPTGISDTDMAAHLSRCRSCAGFTLADARLRGRLPLLASRFSRLHEAVEVSQVTQLRSSGVRRLAAVLRTISALAGSFTIIYSTIRTAHVLSGQGLSGTHTQLETYAFGFCVGIALLMGSVDKDSAWYMRWVVSTTALLVGVETLMEVAAGRFDPAQLDYNIPIVIGAISSAMALQFSRPRESSPWIRRGVGMFSASILVFAAAITVVALVGPLSSIKGSSDHGHSLISKGMLASQVSFLGPVVPPCDARLRPTPAPHLKTNTSERAS